MTIQYKTRRAVFAGVAGLVLSAASAAPLWAETWPVLSVQKNPGCGCCDAWIEQARSAGFTVDVTDAPNYVRTKRGAGVPGKLWSCHTAEIGGYVVEGHVPFAAIKALLRDRPDISGIAVPGMPADSPGMGGDADAVVPVTAWGGAAGDGAPFAFE